MRVIIITSSSSRSGGTRQAVYQARGLAERGHQVTLCLPHDSEYWEYPLSERDSLWFRLPEQAGQMRQAVENLLPAAAEPTIVHAFHNKAVKRVAWWGLWWLRRRLACVAHRGVIFRPGNPLPYLSPAMRAFLVNSRACAKALALHCPPSKIHLVHNAIPDSRVTPVLSPEQARAQFGLVADTAPLLGYVGNDNPVKGVDQLLHAFAAISSTNPKLLLAGTTRAKWQPLCEQLGIAHRVIHVGHQECVADLLQLCDAFVFASYGMDSAPNTLLEAIRMGLPVVATAVGGVPDMLDNNGLLVPPHNVPALALALETMCQNPEQRLRWAAQSRVLGQRYSVTSRCETLERIYADVLPK